MKDAKRGDTIYLNHILECIEDVGLFSDGILDKLHEFKGPWYSTIRALQIMAESTTRLSEETQKKMPDIDWVRVKKFRNVLVHDYLGDMDPEIIRGVILIQLPLLKKEIKRVLAQWKD